MAAAPQHPKSGRLMAAWRRLGGGSGLLAALLAAHLAFGAVRYVGGAWHKRSATIAEYRQHGDLWFFRHADAETQELVRWLLDTVPADAAVLYDGNSRDLIEALHAALHPRLLVHRRALERAEGLGGRSVFAEQPPDSSKTAGEGNQANLGPGWVHGEGQRLRWRRP